MSVTVGLMGTLLLLSAPAAVLPTQHTYVSIAVVRLRGGSAKSGGEAPMDVEGLPRHSDAMERTIAMMEQEMQQAASCCKFEDAARLRDAIRRCLCRCLCRCL